ncbi:MAG: hypothetical protein J6R20_04815 [Clostridia bacterium]|nr:hypothetical protein [Clostridia bacterium]
MKKSRIISAILAGIIAVSSVISLAACNGNETPEASSNATTAPVTEAEKTDVNYVPNETKPAAAPGTFEQDQSRVNEYATKPDGDGSFVTEIASVKFVYPEYFAEGNSYVAIKNIVVDDLGFTSKADAYVDFEVLARGKNEDKVRVSYIGYDAEGNVTRRSQITVNLFGLNVGEISKENRMDFKRETVKIVFTEFTPISE